MIPGTFSALAKCHFRNGKRTAKTAALPPSGEDERTCLCSPCRWSKTHPDEAEAVQVGGKSIFVIGMLNAQRMVHLARFIPSTAVLRPDALVAHCQARLREPRSEPTQLVVNLCKRMQTCSWEPSATKLPALLSSYLQFKPNYCTRLFHIRASALLAQTGELTSSCASRSRRSKGMRSLGNRRCRPPHLRPGRRNQRLQARCTISGKPALECKASNNNASNNNVNNNNVIDPPPDFYCVQPDDPGH